MDKRTNRAALLLACAAWLPAGCGSFSLWPFGGGQAPERARVPANATEYQCAGGKRFHLRMIDNGASAWVILPDREFRLDKLEGTSRFGNGATTLDLAGAEASLSEGANAIYSACRTADAGAGR
jgi:hypothetical protein